MAATIYSGPLTWELERDNTGHRDYRVIHRVRTTSSSDGPQVVMNTPGLPAIGSVWAFGNDVDTWAKCHPDMKVTIYQEKEGDPNFEWQVEQIFSTRPIKRCQDTEIGNPLLEPQRVSGSFVNNKIEATKDKDGQPILMSNQERIKGPQVEFDDHMPTVEIGQNVAMLGLDTFSGMMNTLNISPLWGMAKRQIKLSNVSWEKKYYGSCSPYYTRTFSFDVSFKGFNREIVDEGTKVLNGRWQYGSWVLLDINSIPPDPDNPAHYIQATDISTGTNIRTLLDGEGKPLLLNGTGDNLVYNTVQYYQESNFLLLGIPIIL